MQTISLGIANYCVKCNDNCRYCLLSSRHQTSGVDYTRAKVFFERIFEEAKTKFPDIRFYFYIGYCMDTPELQDFIGFSRKTGSPGGDFLQMNGFAERSKEETEKLIRGIKDAGVQMIDLTFYGTESYHDRFAGRKGDFQILLSMLQAAVQAGLEVNISLPLIRENKDQADELMKFLKGHGASRFYTFLPHSKGRGRSIMGQRLLKQEFESLSEEIKASFTRAETRTEAEWLETGVSPKFEKRDLILVLNPEEMSRLEQMNCEEILKYLEDLDDRFLQDMPSAEVLAERYGDPGNQQLFRFRDLLLKWQQQYIDEAKGTIYDMHDESHHFSVHLQ